MYNYAEELAELLRPADLTIMLPLIYTPLSGESIATTCGAMIKMAQQHGRPVVATFSAVKLRAEPDADADGLVKKYFEDQARRGL